MILINPDNTLISQYDFATTSPLIYKHPAIIGGFGSGKTHSIPLRWLKLIDWRAKEQKVKCKMMIVEPTKEMIRDVLVAEMNIFFDVFGIPHTYHKTYHNYEIVFKGHRFTAMLRSSDEPTSLTGKTVTDIIIDEFDKKHSIDHQKEVYTECLGRIRGADNSTLAIVTTPEGYKYTYELYNECDYREKKNFKLIRAKTYDNKFLPKDYIENMYDQYSAELVKQYIEAQFINLTQGKVYYAFDRTKNNTDKIYNESFPLIVMMDFNVNPMKWAIGQKIGQYDYIIDEIIKYNTYTQDMTTELGQRYGFEKHYLIYGDYSGKFRSTSSRSTDFDLIKEILPNAEIITKPNPGVMDRINAVNSRLCNSRQERRLYVNVQKCPHVVKDLEQVVWHETKKDLDKTSNKDLTHISDAIGYYIEYEYSLKGRPTVYQANN